MVYIYELWHIQSLTGPTLCYNISQSFHASPGVTAMMANTTVKWSHEILQMKHYSPPDILKIHH